MKGVLFSLALALSPTVAAAQDAPLNVVATIGMIGDVAANVGGDCIAVTTLMGPGIDPHLYRASARDVGTFQSADIILYSGYSLEGQLGDVLDRLAATRTTVAVSEGAVAENELLTHQGYGVDPHLWMDVSLWARLVPVVLDTFSAERPGCADDMAANAERYAAELDALHAWVKETIASIPEEKRALVTAHDAFEYYGRAYGIEVAGIQGISTEAEAAVADIRAIADIVAERGIPAMFVESTINPRTIQAVVDAVRERGGAVEIAGQLYSDAMGEAGAVGGTYIGMIYENTMTIAEALGGTPAPLPSALSGFAETWDLASADAP